MKELKTAREWFEQAKSDGREWADEAMREHKKWPLYSAGAKFESMDDAISCAFLWKKTKAGYKFWRKIYDDMQNPLS